MAVIYVLPTYFQASLGASASASGVKILPLVRSLSCSPSWPPSWLPLVYVGFDDRTVRHGRCGID
jgi:hypothetical protein